jgi:hypothetical protein
MAKATFHRHQRVWVEPVGTWAVIDKVNPVWVKGFDEPVRVTYDCGLGRDFAADELRTREDEIEARDESVMHWRLLRARNKWQTPDDCAHHPFPGSYPVVVTDANDWGGWRVPGAEYDRDPELIEMQARLIACAPKLLQLARDLNKYARNETESLGEDLLELAKRAEGLGKLIEPDQPQALGTPGHRAA